MSSVFWIIFEKVEKKFEPKLKHTRTRTTLILGAVETGEKVVVLVY